MPVEWRYFNPNSQGCLNKRAYKWMSLWLCASPPWTVEFVYIDKFKMLLTQALKTTLI